MLVIISDLHLSDGSIRPTLDAGAIRILRKQITTHAIQASWRSESEYRPVEGIDIVLLGDIFDFMQSSYWLENDIRPWHAPHERATIQAFSDVAERIIAANRESLQTLRSLAKSEPIRIAATGAPGSANDTDRHTVPVRLHYMVGEKDWPLSLTGAAYDLLRQTVIQSMGLCQSPEQPLPHLLEDSPVLAGVLKQHRVYAQHGDIADPISFSGNRQSACLANILEIELLQSYVRATIASAGQALPQPFARMLVESIGLVPITQVATRIERLLHRSISSSSLMRKYVNNWNWQVERAFDCAEKVLPKEQFSLTEFEAVYDALQVELPVDARQRQRMEFDIGLKTLQQAVSLSQEHPSCEHFVFGHTENRDSLVISHCQAGTQLRDVGYFNVGSWRASELKSNALNGFCFQSVQNMHLHLFYKDDERCGCPYEIWHGQKGAIRISENAVATAPKSSVRAVRSLVRASVLSRPHFLERNLSGNSLSNSLTDEAR
jgi:UDP-2,3-diacylglucosamine pyrophosphatase LpxH